MLDRLFGSMDKEKLLNSLLMGLPAGKKAELIAKLESAHDLAAHTQADFAAMRADIAYIKQQVDAIGSMVGDDDSDIDDLLNHADAPNPPDVAEAI